MVSHGVPESDWKIFRELRVVALERFCKRVLEELEPLRLDTSRSHHERYLDVFRLLQNRDEELAHAFNESTPLQDDPPARRDPCLWSP